MKWARFQPVSEWIEVARSDTGHRIVKTWVEHLDRWRFVAHGPAREAHGTSRVLGGRDTVEEAVALCREDEQAIRRGSAA